MIPMIPALTQRWWIFVLRGLCGLVLGVVALTQPAATLVALIVLWGAYAFADGATAIWAGWEGRQRSTGLWPSLLVGVTGIVAGVTAWLWPGITALVLLTIIAVWSIARGIFEIVLGIRVRRVIEGEWLLFAEGALSVLFGLVLLSRPGIGLALIVYLIAGYSLIAGGLLVMLGLKLRRLKSTPVHA